MGCGASSENNSNFEGAFDPRSGKYICGQLVVREGETVSIFGAKGDQQIVTGPCAFRPFFSEVQFLKREACDQQSYLVIEYLDGKVEHRRGPTFVMVDPCLHRNVSVKHAIMLEASQALVVYSETETSAHHNNHDDLKSVTRRLVKGPEIFCPLANEWLHRFSWHGSIITGNGKGSITGSPNDTKVAHAVEFTKLRELPDQMYVYKVSFLMLIILNDDRVMSHLHSPFSTNDLLIKANNQCRYYTVRDLRTSDDALLTLHIMIFFELVNIEKMLDSTNDPISDMINAANADVMTYGASRTYEGLLAESNGLSENASYPLLISRMDSIGYKLNKVVYRGYQASSKLQSMQETAISSRTKLRLEADTFRQEQANADFMLNAKEHQSKQKFAQEERETEHKVKMLRVKAEQELSSQRDANSLVLAHEKDMNNERTTYLNSLLEMNVDLTKYLCAQVSSKPTSHLLIENAGDNRGANLHIH